MKKLLQCLSVLVTVSALAACGSGSDKTSSSDKGETSASNSNVEVSIKGGTYVLPQDESSDSHYLALNVEIKNKGNKRCLCSIFFK